MPVIKIVVEHTIEQVVLLHVPNDELQDLSYEDAVCNCPYDELQPEEHYFA